jgi:hypothetical protein
VKNNSVAYDLSKHLELAQNIVERHARTSFLLKGWSVTLIAAILALAERGADSVPVVFTAFLPAFVFWGLDAYYLRHERAYRALYDHVRTGGAKDDPFTLDARPFQRGVSSWARTLCTASLFWFHGTVVIVLLCAAAYFSLRGVNGP